MRKSIMRHILAAVAVALCLLLAFAAFVFDIKLTSQNKTSLLNTASALALSYNEDMDAAQQIAQMKKAANGMRITIIETDGSPLADTNASISEMENHADREEIKTARAAGTGVSTRASETIIGQKLIYAAAKTKSGDYVRVAVKQNGFLLDIVSLLPWLFLSAALAMVFASAMAARFSKSVSKPLLELGETLKKVKDGTVTVSPEDYSYPELQEMACDINDLSQAVNNSLRRLEGEKQRIDYILNNMHEGFIMLDDTDLVLAINTAACAVFECEKQNVSGKSILHATRNIPLLDAISSVRKSGTHARVLLTLPLGKEGEAYINSVQPDGGIIVIIQDVTERQSAAKMRQEFFQSASHELKTPITSIQGFSELLQTSDMDKEQLKKVYTRISKETSRMTTLINDIIMISRLESGDVSFEKELIDVGAVITEICTDAMAQAKQNGITLTCNTVSAVRSVSQREIYELCSNLVQNAVKYNREGGRVDVRLTSNDGNLTLSVFNTGEAIAPEYQSRIFERFFRIDKGRSKAAGGTGLGLAIVKHIALRLRADVSLETSPLGNTFNVIIPK